MPKIHLALAALAIMTLVASPASAQPKGGCAAEARRVEQGVRNMPSRRTDNAIAALYVSEALKAANANDEASCRNWLGRVHAYFYE